MPSPSSPADPELTLETLRARYQKGLLAWLQAPESGAGLAAMTATLAELPPLHPQGQPLWSAALTLLQTIQSGRLPPRVEYRRLAGRVDQALRKASQPPDPLLLQELQAPLAQLDPPPQAPIEALVPRNPLAPTLEATAAILPLMAQTKEPRFTPQQRHIWDQAVLAMSQAWERRRESWAPLRHTVFRLLEGALPLHHPAPLKLAEALASATDPLESAPPSPRLLAALTATLELLEEADFLEHEALEERVSQLVVRLAAGDAGPRSRTLDALFAREAAEEIEHLQLALEAIPPDVEALAEAARRIQHLAEPLDLGPLALCAFRFADTVALLDPASLDHAPGRDDALAWIAGLEAWIQQIGEGDNPPAPSRMGPLQKSLQGLPRQA